MKIFVTGATGFVGQYLLKELSGREDVEVIAYSRAQRKKSCSDVVWVSNDKLGDESWLSNVLVGVDVVIHAAAYAHQTRTTNEEDKEKFIEVNCNLTETLFKISSECGVKQFIFISSIGAIMSESQELILEDTTPAPDNDYGRSKFLAEQKIMGINTSTALTIVRPCLVYGAGNPGNMQRLSSLIDKNVPLPFKSMPAIRSYLYVGNLVNFISSSLLNEAAFNTAFNLADDERVTLDDLIERIAVAKGIKVSMFRFPVIGLRVMGLVGDFLRFLTGKDFGVDSYSVSKLTASLPCSNEKAKEKLSWFPPYTLSDAIAETFKDG